MAPVQVLRVEGQVSSSLAAREMQFGLHHPLSVSMPFAPIPSPVYNILQAFVRAAMIFCHVMCVERTEKSVDVGTLGSIARSPELAPLCTREFRSSIFPSSLPLTLSHLRHSHYYSHQRHGLIGETTDGANTHKESEMIAELSYRHYCHVLLRCGMWYARSPTPKSNFEFENAMRKPHHVHHRSPRPLRLPLIATSVEFPLDPHAYLPMCVSLDPKFCTRQWPE